MACASLTDLRFSSPPTNLAKLQHCRNLRACPESFVSVVLDLAFVEKQRKVCLADLVESGAHREEQLV